nr:MAG TPA: protein of unknown function DUF1424 [Inoviridae sp.]
MNRIKETTSEGVKHPAAPLLDSSLISKYEDVERRIIYDVKIIHCGDTYQIYKFDKTRSKENKKDRDIPIIPKVSIKDIDTDNLYKPDRVEEVKPILLSNAIRSNLNCQRIAKANRDNWESFITLTFKENITDIVYANKIFNAWVSNVRKLKKDFKYIAVPEFQKRGAVHYHILSNLGKEDTNIIIPQKERTEKTKDLTTLFDVKYWNRGFARVDFIKGDYKKIYSYICKYMTKDIDDKLFGKHRYFNSQNLNKPREEFLDLSNERDLKHFNDIINNSSIDYSSQYKDIYTDSNIEFIEVIKSQ